VSQACCSDPFLSLVAQSARGREIARLGNVNRGIPFAIWRCTRCEGITFEGWEPPTWISAVARAREEIRRELAAALSG